MTGGATPGDGPGFPVTLSTSGSFRLSGDLDLRVLGLPASANTDAIQITSTATVTIDLNGFSILGPTSCFAPPCTDSGSGYGVRVPQSGGLITVKNGVIHGMGANGIVGEFSTLRIEDVSVEHCGFDGIRLSLGSVRGAIASQNGDEGIEAGAALVTASAFFANLGYGIQAGSGSLVENCVVRGGDGPAVLLAGGSLADSALFVNTGAAVECVGECAISGN
jgi:hypothetical protein